MKTIQINSLSEIGAAAREFLQNTSTSRIYAFYAPMGCGKTTFIRALCEELGIKDVVNSPTFAIANRYSLPERDQKVFHIDCYRLKNEEEALSVGFEDFLSPPNICFIEWPEVIESLLPEETLTIKITQGEKGERILSF